MPNKRFSVLLLGVIVILFVTYSSEWVRMVNSTSDRTATDFMAFYAGGRVADQHGFPASYDIELQQDVQQEVLGFELAEGQVLLYNHVPYILPLISGVVDENYAGSFARWAGLLLFIYLTGTAFLIHQLFPGTNLTTRLLTIGGMITFLPVFISLRQGQDTAFVYAGVVLWCVGLLKKQDTLTSIGLALTTVRPHIAITLGLPILIRYRKALWPLAVLGAALLLFCLWLFKLEGLVGFLQLIRISAEGTWFGMKPGSMFNLLGLIIRLFPSISPATANLLSWIIFGIGLVLTAGLWLKWKAATEQLISSTLLIAVLFAPHLHLHDLTLLLFPILFTAMKESSRYPIALFHLGASLVLLVSFLTPVLFYTLPYLLCLVLAWRLLRQSQPQEI